MLVEKHVYSFSYLVPKRDMALELEKVVPHSMVMAVRKELESTTCAITAEQSGLPMQKKRSP